MSIHFTLNIRVACLLFALLVSSCESFLDVDSPASKIPSDLVYADEAAASSAAVGMYIKLYEAFSFAGGGTRSILTLCGLAADELVNVPKKDRLYLDFEQNTISPLNDNIVNLWSTLYSSTYSANALIEGISNSASVTESVRRQLRGEALFIRAFCHFYLVNLFGDVPLVVSTSYMVNSHIPRSASEKVYDQIKLDLTEAEDLLSDVYINGERTRANKSSATALLARVYLFTGEWARSEDKATKVIENSGLYRLSTLSNVFFANSSETILQLRPLSTEPVTNEANIFSFNSAVNFNALNDDILNAFEENDQRLNNWVVGYPNGDETLYLPNKYRRYRTGSPLPNEYSMVIRFAEMYLIRAEARLRQEKTLAAISDLDTIRSRAGLPKVEDIIPGISVDDLLLVIEAERRVEFLCEWGHRWFDLKRWHRSASVLGLIKENWSDDDLLFPIPETEISKNMNLGPQNPGY